MYQSIEKIRKAATYGSAMEQRPFQKRESLKSLMSRGNIMSIFFYSLAIVMAIIACFTSCEQGDEPMGKKINDDVSTKLLASFSKATYNDDLYRDYEFSIKMECSDSGWKLAYSRQAGKWNPYVADFWYQIYESDNAIVIAFRGTPEWKSIADAGDWINTLKLILGNDHPQDNNVIDEVVKGGIAEYLKKAEENKKKVFLTGHSLGGHLAMIAYLYIHNRNFENVVGKVETFNAVGLQKDDADAINKNGVNKIRQNYTCCDIAAWGSEFTILGLGKLYFPAVEREPLDIKIKTPTHKHSTDEDKDDTKFSIGKAAHGIENFVDCEITIDPTAINPETGLNEDIIPYNILEEIKGLGLEINSGNTPPQIGGNYLIAPVNRVRSNFTDYTNNFADIYLTFDEQDNTTLTVKTQYAQAGYQGIGTGSFISGEGNKFTVYVPIVNTDIHGHIFDMIEVYSGEIENGGIRNWQEVLIMKDDHGDPCNGHIENSQGRLFKDGDGFSEKTGGGFRSSRTSKSSLPSIISNKKIN